MWEAKQTYYEELQKENFDGGDICDAYEAGWTAALKEVYESLEKVLLGKVNVKVLPTNFKETEFCLSDYDEVKLITNYVKEGRLKMGDEVKILFMHKS